MINQEIRTYGVRVYSDLSSLTPNPPAIAFVEDTNTYYFRKAGGYRGKLEDKGIVKYRQADTWEKLDVKTILYTVQSKRELMELVVSPPAFAFRTDNSRYYVLIGPEGYGGHTGTTQARDENTGALLFDGGDPIRRTVVIEGANSTNTLYFANSTELYDRVPAGSTFSILNKKFTITAKSRTSSMITWMYSPSYDIYGALNGSVGNVISSYYSPINTIAPPASVNNPTNVVRVIGTGGIILVDNSFTTNDPKCPGTYTITQMSNSTWFYTPETPQPIANGSILTMTGKGNPIIVPRESNKWICVSHLYDDNEGYL